LVYTIGNSRGYRLAGPVTPLVFSKKVFLGTFLNLVKYYDLDWDVLEVAKRVGVSNSATFQMVSSKVI